MIVNELLILKSIKSSLLVIVLFLKFSYVHISTYIIKRLLQLGLARCNSAFAVFHIAFYVHDSRDLFPASHCEVIMFPLSVSYHRDS